MTTYFRDNFILRFSIWTIGTMNFIFGLNFIFVSQLGFTTITAFLTSLRILVDIQDPTLYGRAILIPFWLILLFSAILIHYLRTKKLRIDYLLGVVPIFIIGFIFDAVLGIAFFNNILSKNLINTSPFTDNPISILYLIIGIILYTFGLGLQGSCKIAPNAFIVFVEEIAFLIKKKYIHIQWGIDFIFIVTGTIFGIISIHYGFGNNDEHGNFISLTWWDLFKIVGVGTVIILLFQGLLISYSAKLNLKFLKLFYSQGIKYKTKKHK